MSGSGEKLPPFVRQDIPIGPGYVGSRWWNTMMVRGSDATRRSLLTGVSGAFLITAASIGMRVAIWQYRVADRDYDDDVETVSDALDLQRRTSWDVGIGGTNPSLTFAGATKVDVDGGPAWQAPLIDGHLDEALRPIDIHLQPFYVPTLFQAPAAASAQGLKAVLSPISTPATETAFLRGQALATLLKVTDSPPGVGLIVDVPGPEAVAVAAGLAEAASPVFTFANWPHPLGVVSSHLTLASALYYLPIFRRMDVVRPLGAPPAFILDANRLAPYRDDANQFDNRYVASLPSVDSLRALRIQKLLYVRPDGDSTLGLQELDDLNSDLVAYQQAGIEVRAVALSDFRPEIVTATATAPARDAGVATTTSTVHTTHTHYWGGWSGGRSYFWSSYGWGHSAPVVRTAPPMNVSRAPTYRPTPRATMFSARPVGTSSALGSNVMGKQKPSGFGRVTFRTARGSGAVTSVRTGSFGRTRFFSGGG